MTGLFSLVTTAVVIGEEVGRPRKTSTLERLPKCGKIVLFKADCTIGSRVGHDLKGNVNSSRRGFKQRTSSLFTTSTVPFYQGVYSKDSGRPVFLIWLISPSDRGEHVQGNTGPREPLRRANCPARKQVCPKILFARYIYD
jgi:hypothetical protein